MSNDLKKAIEKRNAFLKEHPDLQPFQDEIDRVLDSTTSHEDRTAALQLMISCKVQELSDILKKLQKSMKDIVNAEDKC